MTADEQLEPEEEVTKVVAYALRDADLKASMPAVVRGLLLSAAGTFWANTSELDVEKRRHAYMELAAWAFVEHERTAANGEVIAVTPVDEPKSVN